MEMDYRADDRRDDEDDDEGVPTTFAALAVMWAERDSIYAVQRRPLTPEQIGAIRQGRVREATQLPVGERGKAGMAALTWYPQPAVEWRGEGPSE